MTPAIDTAKNAGISFTTHSYEHDLNTPSYGEEAADKLGLDPNRVFKTLVVDIGNKALGVAIVSVSHMLDLKQFAKAVGAKKAVMADPKQVQRTTGYVLGGVSPLGQKKALPTVIDVSASAFETIYVSAGKRGLDIEISPKDLSDLTRASFHMISK